MIEMPELMIEKAAPVSASAAPPASASAPIADQTAASTDVGSMPEERSAMQLELLPDPPSDQKLATGS
jgi:hypothetical protein